MLTRTHSTRQLRNTLTLLAIALASPAFAFDPPVDTAGPLTVRIEGPEQISQFGKPLPFKVSLQNTADIPLKGILRLTAIDGWQAEPAQASFALEGKTAKTLDFTVTATATSYNAFYPLHVFADFSFQGKAQTAHAVIVVRANNPNPPRPQLAPVEFKPVDLRPGGRIALRRLPARRVIVAVFNKPPQVMPVGWQGSEPATLASFDFSARVDRGGQTRPAIAIHPPFHHDLAGTAAVQYPVRLPAGVPIRLRFANAIRDNDAARGEPPSDGVTFRVRVMDFAPDAGIDAGRIFYEKHTDSKKWEPADLDLAGYAGRDVIIQLESHPGPKHDTTCDQSYWAEPVLSAGFTAGSWPGVPANSQKAGKMPAPLSLPFPPAAEEQANPGGGPPARLLELGTLQAPGGPCKVRVWPGRRGLLDAAVGFDNGQQKLFFHGIHVRINGDDLHDPAAPSQILAVKEEAAPPGGCRFRHSVEAITGRYDLMIHLEAGGPALRARVWLENAPAAQPWRVTYLEDVWAGEWSEAAPRIYAGQGNVIQDPQRFDLSFDGHRLSTSFVGFDFANGVSLVQATDAIPNRLEVDPHSRQYTLHTPHAQTLFFVPADNVFNGARVWHDINGLKLSAGVHKLAGRFVFDWWGGDYAGTAKALERSFRYGLTNSLVLWHNWQRYGYDNRLPDIYPPNPKYGTLKQFQNLVKLCKDHGVLFAAHDNYIDYYPDAEGYSYDHIAFAANREPVLAWFNPGPKAQAYRWRADHIRPVVEHNLKLIRDGFNPTAYFIDVFSSIEPYDYWTQDGRFFPRTYTTQTWRETFDWIRDYLGDDAPQISESGHDALIGHLDGSQTNHLRVGPPLSDKGWDRWFTWDLRCGDAERIPWFDAAHHDRFALHGAGYESRYTAGLDAKQHGMYSDDYISTEVLTGHPGMVHPPFGRDVVRKYWLLNHLMSALAEAHIESVEFDRGNIHRQRVQWNGGRGKFGGPGVRGHIWVNRSDQDWTVNLSSVMPPNWPLHPPDHTLPPYGFYASLSGELEGVEAAIERKDGRTVEWVRGPGYHFLNVRSPAGKPDKLVQPILDVPISIDGGFRIDSLWTITPLPDEAPRTLHVDWQGWFNNPDENPKKILALSETGQVLRETPAHVEKGVLTVKTEPGVFAYRVIR